MAIVDPTTTDWTASDLVARFGPLPLRRLRLDPPPGSATEDDLLAVLEAKAGLCELIDGTLVEKTMGHYEEYLAGWLLRRIGDFADNNRLGIVYPSAGAFRLVAGQVRLPDVSYVSFDRLPNRRIPRDPIGTIVPDLAVEVISPGNTREEMDRKLREYFAAGVRQVWYLYPVARQLHVFRAPDDCTIVPESGLVDGGDVLPGLDFPLAQLFAEPGTA